MVDPLIALAVNIEQGAERAFVERFLGALIDQTALLARVRPVVGVGLDEILTDLRADRLQKIAKVDQDRIVAVERPARRSEEHTSELQSLMRTSYAVFCLKKKK